MSALSLPSFMLASTVKGAIALPCLKSLLGLRRGGGGLGQGKTATEMQVRRLEAKLEAALKEKSDLEQRFGALLAIADASATRLHSPPATVVSPQAPSPLVGQALRKGESSGRAAGYGGVTEDGYNGVGRGGKGDAQEGAFSPYRSGELRKSTLFGGSVEPWGQTGGADAPQGVDDTRRYEQVHAAGGGDPNGDQPTLIFEKSSNLTEAPTLHYGDREPVAGHVGQAGGAGSGARARSESGTQGRQVGIALPQPQLDTPSSTPARALGRIASDERAVERAAGLVSTSSVVQRLAEFRDTKSATRAGHHGQAGGDAGRAKRGVVLPSPPPADYLPTAQRQGLVEEQQLKKADGPGGSQESASVALNFGAVLLGSDRTNQSSASAGQSGGESGAGTNDSVSEKLKSIHSAFAALRAKSQSSR